MSLQREAGIKVDHLAEEGNEVGLAYHALGYGSADPLGECLRLGRARVVVVLLVCVHRSWRAGTTATRSSLV